MKLKDYAISQMMMAITYNFLIKSYNFMVYKLTNGCGVWRVVDTRS